MTDEMSEEQIYEEAKKRVEEKKGFRIHATAYVAVNAFLALIWWLTGAGFPWFVFPAGWLGHWSTLSRFRSICLLKTTG